MLGESWVFCGSREGRCKVSNAALDFLTSALFFFLLPGSRK